uniref:Uncharacterized protein n=1 Tax=Mesocestoides corti TaxID=53468 RepID=A0A5K3EXI1_MESCO
MICWSSTENASCVLRIFLAKNSKAQRQRIGLAHRGAIFLRPCASKLYNVNYLSPRMKKISTRDMASLANHKPKRNLWRRSSESITPATPLIIYCSSFVSAYLRMPLERRETED